MPSSDSQRSSGTVSGDLLRAYEDHSTARCLLTRTGWLSFAEVAALAAQAAEVLAINGVSQGDRVVIYLENSAMARVLDNAVLGFGFVRVAISSRLHPHEVVAIARDAVADVICCDAAREAELQQIAVADSFSCKIIGFSDVSAGHTLESLSSINATRVGPSSPIRPDDIAMLMYSSGTTGKPKGAIVTNEMWIAQTTNALAAMPQVNEADVVVLAAPMQHFGGSIGLDCSIAGAATVPLVPFNATEVLDSVLEHGGTILPLVPTLLARLVAVVPSTQKVVSSLRCIPYGGSPVATNVLIKASQNFPGTLTQFYGLAEALAPLTVLTPSDHDEATRRLVAGQSHHEQATRRLQSAGRWVHGVEHRTSAGELEVRGPTVMPGYWRRDDLTKEVIRDGWFRTGDVIYQDDDGYVRFGDRASDVIISGGFNVYPREVEIVIEQLPEIREVAVLGAPDERWGEGVHAVIVLTSAGLTDISQPNGPTRLRDRVRDICLASLAGYKKPVAIHVINELPRNPAGKVDRSMLRSQISGSATARFMINV